MSLHILNSVLNSLLPGPEIKWNSSYRSLFVFYQGCRVFLLSCVVCCDCSSIFVSYNFELIIIL